MLIKKFVEKSYSTDKKEIFNIMNDSKPALGAKREK